MFVLFCGALPLMRWCSTVALLVEHVLQGRTMPTRAAHAASFCGAPLVVGVTAPNMHQTKFQVDMNNNSYVGQLRQQIAAKPAFGIPSARLRMFLGGAIPELAFAATLASQRLHVCPTAADCTALSSLAAQIMCYCASYMFCKGPSARQVVSTHVPQHHPTKQS